MNTTQIESIEASITRGVFDEQAAEALREQAFARAREIIEKMGAKWACHQSQRVAKKEKK